MTTTDSTVYIHHILQEHIHEEKQGKPHLNKITIKDIKSLQHLVVAPSLVSLKV